MFCGKDTFAVHRKKMGIQDLDSFKDKVRAAMKKTAEYNLSEYNCIHFALELLNVDLKVIHLFLASQKITMSHKVIIMSDINYVRHNTYNFVNTYGNKMKVICAGQQVTQKAKLKYKCSLGIK